MDARLAKQRMEEFVREYSGVEEQLPYLRMSKIGYCPRLLFNLFCNGKGPITDQAHLNCLSGHMIHDKMKWILVGAGVMEPRWLTEELTITSDFEDEFRGHPDGKTCDGDLIEIKSMDADEYRAFQNTGDIPHNFAWQIQAYMRYGSFAQTLFVAVCRDPFTYWTRSVRRDDLVGKRIEEKAKMVLAAIASGTPPPCTCGRHVNPRATGVNGYSSPFRRPSRGPQFRGARA